MTPQGLNLTQVVHTYIAWCVRSCTGCSHYVVGDKDIYNQKTFLEFSRVHMIHQYYDNFMELYHKRVIRHDSQNHQFTPHLRKPWFLHTGILQYEGCLPSRPQLLSMFLSPSTSMDLMASSAQIHLVSSLNHDLSPHRHGWRVHGSHGGGPVTSSTWTAGPLATVSCVLTA